ncbi:MAG: mechanosensitive ion channel family protein [Prolixibacteraceae bacterium]|nr:mechanosensitive ion channel family protein [Prolixibacteraceae bacterium]
MQHILEFLYKWTFKAFGNESFSEFTSTAILGLAILIFAVIVFYVTRLVLISITRRLSKRTKTEWDDILIKHKIFQGISHFLPAIIIYFFSGFGSVYYPSLQEFIKTLCNIYFLGTGLFVINAFLSSLNEIYNKSFPAAKERPIAGFIQLLKIFLYFIGLLVLIAIIFNKELGTLFAGLGAAAAILILVFKDSILGFVASIQISMNNMVKIGDWLEMPSKNADGEVIEINLTTVKVKNWDKTISNLPTYSLISESFINWKGMEESGGRRIKRSIYIDMTSVKFCTQEMLEKFQKFMLIKDYVAKKQQEIEEFNASLKIPPKEHFNGRRQTNLGIFRKYLEAYLHNNQNINDKLTFLIRHLQPTEKGIPIEIYVFSNDTRWANYEAIQADIFDHVLAVLPEFELRVFQNPSGADILKLRNE